VHAVPCCPATVYAVLLWLYLLSAFGKLNTYIHTSVFVPGDPVTRQSSVPGSSVRTPHQGAGHGLVDEKRGHSRHIQLPSSTDVQRHSPTGAAAAQTVRVVQQDKGMFQPPTTGKHHRQAI